MAGLADGDGYDLPMTQEQLADAAGSPGMLVDQARNVALWGLSPDWAGLTSYLAVSIAFAYAGCLWFQSTRRGFADVL